MTDKPVQHGRQRRGAALVEFALAALVLYLLLVVVIDLGRMVYTAQVLQDAARAGARELSLLALPAEADFASALPAVFDPEFLVIDCDVEDCENPPAMPPLNQALLPVMIRERVSIAGADRNLLRYPGALLSDPSMADGLTVGVPRIDGRGADGVETITWLEIVTEAQPGQFPLSGGGRASLLINYPFQAAAASSFRENPDGPFEPNIAFSNQAQDGGVTQNNAPVSGAVIPSLSGVGTYTGPFGLGRQLALGREIRPFRRVLAGQAIFSREVFE